jgi:hypothetical protein
VKEALKLIIDYLENPSTDEQQDKERRHKLSVSLGLDPKKKPGVLGEKIVEIFYEVQNIPYERNVKVPVSRVEPVPKIGKSKKNHKLDGLENNEFYVEVKIRVYQSTGTANEKIPSIAFKYGDLPKKLKIFLLADDEHKYNLYWSKLVRGDIESSNPHNSNYEENYKKIHSELIEKIVYGTEVASVLRNYI